MTLLLSAITASGDMITDKIIKARLTAITRPLSYGRVYSYYMLNAIRKVVGFATLILGIVAMVSVITFSTGYASQKNTLSETFQSILFVVTPFIASWLLLSNRTSIHLFIGYVLAALCLVFLAIYM